MINCSALGASGETKFQQAVTFLKRFPSISSAMTNEESQMKKEEAVAAMEATNFPATGASEYQDRELATPVQVEADEGPSTFVYIQNRVTLFAIQLHTINSTCYISLGCSKLTNNIQ